MATEKLIRECVERYIEKTPDFANDKAKAIAQGCTVDDSIDVILKDACGHPTASLVRTYIHPKEQWNELRSAFDVQLKGRDWVVRCSDGRPGPDRD